MALVVVLCNIFLFSLFVCRADGGWVNVAAEVSSCVYGERA